MSEGERALGIRLLADLAASSNDAVAYPKADTNLKRWIRTATAEQREELAASSPHARAVVTQYIRKVG